MSRSGASLTSLSISGYFPASVEGCRIVISGSGARRLYVTLVRGGTVNVRRPGLVDWAFGRIFGWWR